VSFADERQERGKLMVPVQEAIEGLTRIHEIAIVVLSVSPEAMISVFIGCSVLFWGLKAL